MNWHKDILLLDPLPPQAIIDWLTGPQILSAALGKVYTEVSLKLLSEGPESIMETEQEALSKLAPVQADYFVRSVFLLGDKVPVIFARTVIPASTYAQYKENFTTLGNQFIGMRLLHNKENVVRSEFEYATINAQHPLYQKAAGFGNQTQEHTLWARRSLFWIEGLPLLITELFLSSLSRVASPPR